MNPLLERLHLKHISELFDVCYHQIREERGTPEWLTEDFIRTAAQEFPFLPTHLDLVLSALPAVRANGDLVLFARILHRMLGMHRPHEEIFPTLRFPTAPEGVPPLAYDLFAFYPMLARVLEAYRALRQKGVDEAILQATATDLDNSITASTRRVGRPAFTLLYFLWSTTQSNQSLFRIGRLNFELVDRCPLHAHGFRNAEGQILLLMREGLAIHRGGLLLGSPEATDPAGSFVTTYEETDCSFRGYAADPVTGLVQPTPVELPKSLWTHWFAPGDCAVSVHIPADGSFDPATVEASLEAGRTFFRKLYPDREIKAYLCISWMLAPELQTMLRPDSNVLAFRNRFARYPFPGTGLDVFTFLFTRLVDDLSQVDLAALPAETSLTRSVKDHYLAGKYVHEAGGIMEF